MKKIQSILENELYISDYYKDNEKNYIDRDLKIEEIKRINIDYVEEIKDYPWRFYIKDNKYVSVTKK